MFFEYSLCIEKYREADFSHTLAKKLKSASLILSPILELETNNPTVNVGIKEYIQCMN